MTIKQNGGIFGRNPTFNDVTVDNNLEVTGTSYLDGYVGIGVNPADTGLHLQGTDNVSSSFTIKNTVNNNTWRLQPQYNSLKLRIFGQGSEVAEFDASNNLNLVGGGNLIVSSGNGIDFSATSGTGTSELFDDYEEGTFTPTITSGAGSFSSITYDNARSGQYTKVGNLVHFQIRMRTDAISVGTASGAVVINGLPFTSVNEQTSCSVYSQDMGGESPITGQIQNSDTVLVVYYYSGTSYSILDVTDLATGGNSNYMFITGTYTAA